MVMNRTTATNLSKIVSDLLQGLPKEYGAKVLSGSFDPSAGTLTVKVVIGPKVQESYTWTPEYRALLELTKYSDEWMNPDHITPDMLQKSFDIPTIGPCKLVGFKTRSQKFPYIVRTPAGKQYKVNGRSIKHSIGLLP